MSREMKESGIPWIGRIPSHWNILRIKNTSWLKGRIGWDGLKSSEFIDDGPYLITGTDFSNGKVNWDTCVHITEERYAEDILLHIYEGDLLITKDGTIGKLAVVSDCPEKVSLNSGVMIIRGNNPRWKYNKKYMYYLLSSPEFTIWFSLMQKPNSTIQHLYQHQFSDFQYTFPPLPEQAAIVSFLDSRCAKIDEAISHHRQIIEKLEEYRKAVITKAVTKGLDSNVEMRDSGISWIGEIPNSWDTIRLKFLCKEHLKYGANETGCEYNSSLCRYIRITDIDENGRLKENDKKSLTEEQAKGYILEDGTILFARSGATVGKTFLYETSQYGRAGFAGYLIAAIPNNAKMFSKWLYYFTKSSPYWNWAGQIFNQATIQNIGADKYSNLLIPIPDTKQQEEIINYLDKVCRYIREYIVKHNQVIKKLEEYRKSIIYRAVTGKIDCRDSKA